MLVIRKRNLRQVGLAFLTAAVMALSVASVVAAATPKVTVEILSQPIRVDDPVYQDANANGLSEARELVGRFPIFDGNRELQFRWQPYTFPEGTQGAYRVSLVQRSNPLFSRNTREIKINYHWHTDDPAGLTYSLGSFGFGESVCTYCPTTITVTPVLVERNYDAQSGVTTFRYTAIRNAPVQVSGEFVFDITRICADYQLRCIHNTAEYQKYFVALETCVCGCVLTDEICRKEYGPATADLTTCTCR